MKKKKNSRGFTLIELLAVIIILGILMIIAIPSVTSYINNSRKSAYVSTAKEIVSGARTFVNEGKLEMFDTTATYYIPVSCISTENGQKSPYGDFVENQAFVIVTYTGSNYNYYWISRDTTGQGVKTITPVGELDEDDIVSDISSSEITPTEPAETGKNTIKVLSKDDCKTFGEGNGGGSQDVVNYMGKTRETVTTGDLVKIGEEEFYVLTNDRTNDKITMLAHYNLKVGEIFNRSYEKIGEYSSTDEGYGKQSSEAKGDMWDDGNIYGTVAFSNTYYWEGKIGTIYSGNICIDDYQENCADIFDSNSSAYSYFNNYKEFLEKNGVSIERIRLPYYEDLISLGCTYNEIYAELNYPSNYSFISETSYWLANPGAYDRVWSVRKYAADLGSSYTNYNEMGIRPVIIF